MGYMDQCGYDFVVMMKGMKAFVRGLLLENRGSFENIREHSIRKYRVSGIIVKRRLYEGGWEREILPHFLFRPESKHGLKENTLNVLKEILEGEGICFLIHCNFSYSCH